ncbi:uncharacterized protein LOC144582037 isoform X3 [Callithrix jacchus]
MTATWANYLSAMKEPKPERPRFCNSSATQCRCLPETQSCLCPLSSFHRQPTQQGSGGGRRCRWLAFLLSSALLLHLSEEPQVAAAGEGFSSFLFSPTATTLT